MATKITFRPEGAADDSQDVILADGTGDTESLRGIANGSAQVSLAFQPINRIRAEHAEFRPRGNRAGIYSFSASRSFPTIPEAGRFALSHGMKIQQAGTLIFDFGDGVFTHLLGVVFTHIGPVEQLGAFVRTNYACSYSDAAEVPRTHIKINCGEVSADGWLADTDLYGAGATAAAITDPIDGAGDELPQDVLRSCRRAETLTYTIATPPGWYSLKLHFAEFAATAAEERTFEIYAQGELLSDCMDIFAEAGCAKKAHTFIAPQVHALTAIEIVLEGLAGEAQLNGIEIISIATPPPEASP